MAGDFAAAASELSGACCAALSWRPHEFWQVTPAELEAVLTALAPEGRPVDAGALQRLKEQFPDG